MGIWSALLSKLGISKRKSNLLIIGLDNSGKTTIINHIRPDPVPSNEIVPTVGFSTATFRKGDINFTVFDMSGQGKYRDLWGHYFSDTDAIIFVLDSTDKLRACVAKDELDIILGSVPRKIPILFLSNKMDLEGGLTAIEFSQVLGLDAIKDRNWYICSCNGLSGEGLDGGMEWLVDTLNKVREGK